MVHPRLDGMRISDVKPRLDLLEDRSGLQVGVAVELRIGRAIGG